VFIRTRFGLMWVPFFLCLGGKNSATCEFSTRPIWRGLHGRGSFGGRPVKIRPTVCLVSDWIICNFVNLELCSTGIFVCLYFDANRLVITLPFDKSALCGRRSFHVLHESLTTRQCFINHVMQIPTYLNASALHHIAVIYILIAASEIIVQLTI
jgi:hypothetical protein